MLCYAADLLSCAIEHHFPCPTSVGANVNTARSCSVDISFAPTEVRKCQNDCVMGGDKNGFLIVTRIQRRLIASI